MEKIKNQKTQPNPDWRTGDLRNWIRQDLKAAVALLDLLQSNEELFNLVCAAVEGWRKNMIENEKNVPQPESVES